MSSVWKNNDKKWLKARKDEWRKIKTNLDLMSFHIPRRGHKYHKHLFFTGEMHPEYRIGISSNIFDGGDELFKMWYHPEPSAENFKKLFNEIDTEYGMHHCRDILFKFPLIPFATEYGMFGGREELIVKALYPELDYSKTKQLDRGYYEELSFRPRQIFKLYTSYCTIILDLNENNRNPFYVIQYLWDYFLYAVEHYSDKVYSDNSFDRRNDIYYLRLLMRKIADFESRLTNPEEYPKAIALQQFLFQQLEAGNLPDFIQQYWVIEKADHESGNPYPERPERTEDERL